MRLISIRREGETSPPGLSLYLSTDRHSSGGGLRIGDWCLRVRWSTRRRRLFVNLFKLKASN